MKRKVASGMMLTLLLVSMLTLAFNIQPAIASGTIYIRADGSVYPSTANITSADNVTYTFRDDIYGSIVVERDNITIDGAGCTLQGTGYRGISLTERSNITIKNMEIKAFSYGIWLRHSYNNSISGSNITNNNYGIWFEYSSNNSISGNNIADNRDDGIALYWSSNHNSIFGNNITANKGYGILLSLSLNNVFRSNSMASNTRNFGVDGMMLSDFVNDVDVSNSVDGKLIYYWISKRDMTVPLDAGYVALVNCTGITVQNLNLTNNHSGALLAYTTNSTITRNNITNNDGGIVLYGSSNNTITRNSITANNYNGIWLGYSSDYNSISGNDITNNYHGIVLYGSSNNTITRNSITANNRYGIVLSSSSNNIIYHNNFVDNTEQVDSYDSTNVWDDGYPSGGNYWSDYAGQDLDGDGIGDTSYPIDADNEDRYPLMGPINAFDAGTWNNIAYSVNVASNSTVSDLYFNPDEGAFIKFNVAGPEDTTGFCRVTIPKQLLSVNRPEEWIVKVGNDLVVPEVSEDENYTYLYFTYPHSTKTVVITGTRVIPEFPTWTQVLSILILLTVAITITKRRLPKTPIH